MRSILDPSFRYTPSYETDLRKTFERLRREQQERRQVQAGAAKAKAAGAADVLSITRAR